MRQESSELAETTMCQPDMRGFRPHDTPSVGSALDLRTRVGSSRRAGSLPQGANEDPPHAAASVLSCSNTLPSSSFICEAVLPGEIVGRGSSHQSLVTVVAPCPRLRG